MGERRGGAAGCRSLRQALRLTGQSIVSHVDLKELCFGSVDTEWRAMFVRDTAQEVRLPHAREGQELAGLHVEAVQLAHDLAGSPAASDGKGFGVGRARMHVDRPTPSACPPPNTHCHHHHAAHSREIVSLLHSTPSMSNSTASTTASSAATGAADACALRRCVRRARPARCCFCCCCC